MVKRQFPPALTAFALQEFIRPFTQDLQLKLREVIKPALEGRVGGLAEKFQGIAQALGLVLGPIVLALFFSILDLYRPLFSDPRERLVSP